MDIDNEIISVSKKVENIYQATEYTRAEAIELIKAAALVKLSDCVRDGRNSRPYFNITGSVATYEQ